jgi:hypothetical protein
MHTMRHDHTATLLENGQVLIVGGGCCVDGLLDTAELYDPLTDTWMGAGRMATDRAGHTATLIATGQVLVAGGGLALLVSANLPATTELYDPAIDSWPKAIKK